jgi:hypothetical protein
MDVNLAMDEIYEDIISLAQECTAQQFIVRLRNELANVDRMSNRIETIKGNHIHTCGIYCDPTSRWCCNRYVTIHED